MIYSLTDNCEPIDLASVRRERGLDAPVLHATEPLVSAGYLQGRVVRHSIHGWQGTVLGVNREGRVAVWSEGMVRTAWNTDLTAPEYGGAA